MRKDLLRIAMSTFASFVLVFIIFFTLKYLRINFNIHIPFYIVWIIQAILSIAIGYVLYFLIANRKIHENYKTYLKWRILFTTIISLLYIFLNNILLNFFTVTVFYRKELDTYFTSFASTWTDLSTVFFTLLMITTYSLLERNYNKQ